MQFLQKRQNRSEEILTQWRNYCQQNFERVVSNEIDAMVTFMGPSAELT